MVYLIGFIIVSYFVIGFIVMKIIKASKPDRYVEQWLKVNDNLGEMNRPLPPKIARFSYDVGLIAVFPMSIWEYFIKRERIEPERFNHKKKRSKK